MRNLLLSLILAASYSAAAQQPAPAPAPPPKPDTSFDAMQLRGASTMGVDQYTSTHIFDDLVTGGRITFQRDSADSAGTAAIRAHLRDVAKAFQAGDFSAPEFVHADSVPGTAVMRARRAMITYSVLDIARGAQLTMSTSDPAALAAIHQFFAYQRHAHHAGGMTH